VHGIISQKGRRMGKAYFLTVYFERPEGEKRGKASTCMLIILNTESFNVFFTTSVLQMEMNV